MSEQERLKRSVKKILVYLFHQFYENEKDIKEVNALITQEMLERKIDSSEKAVNYYLKQNQIRLKDYRTILDSNYPKKMAYGDIPIMIFPKGWKYISNNVN
jgi:hypothetical protein